MKTIELTRGFSTIVDDKDYYFLSQWNWFAMYNGKKNYAARKHKKTHRVVYMHREIMNAPEGMTVDHVDNDGMNNSRANLRIATYSQNLANRGKSPLNTSGYKSVYWDKKRKLWMSKLDVFGKQIYGGWFPNPQDAARRSDELMRQYHGSFAKLNFGGNA